MKKYDYDFRVGSTTGYRNVHYVTVTATSEAEALEQLKKQYNDPRDTFVCTKSGEEVEKKIEEERKKMEEEERNRIEERAARKE